MTVRILGVVALIALIALAPAHAQRRDSKALKDARDDIEAARTLPPYSSYAPNSCPFSGLPQIVDTYGDYVGDAGGGAGNCVDCINQFYSFRRPTPGGGPLSLSQAAGGLRRSV